MSMKCLECQAGCSFHGIRLCEYCITNSDIIEKHYDLPPYIELKTEDLMWFLPHYPCYLVLTNFGRTIETVWQTNRMNGAIAQHYAECEDVALSYTNIYNFHPYRRYLDI